MGRTRKSAPKNNNAAVAPVRAASLTFQRKEKISEFKRRSRKNATMFGKIGGQQWQDELLQFLNDERITSHDVNRWVCNHPWITKPMDFQEPVASTPAYNKRHQQLPPPMSTRSARRMTVRFLDENSPPNTNANIRGSPAPRQNHRSVYQSPRQNTTIQHNANQHNRISVATLNVKTEYLQELHHQRTGLNQMNGNANGFHLVQGTPARSVIQSQQYVPHPPPSSYNSETPVRHIPATRRSLNNQEGFANISMSTMPFTATNALEDVTNAISYIRGLNEICQKYEDLQGCYRFIYKIYGKLQKFQERSVIPQSLKVGFPRLPPPGIIIKAEPGTSNSNNNNPHQPPEDPVHVIEEIDLEAEDGNNGPFVRFPPNAVDEDMSFNYYKRM